MTYTTSPEVIERTGIRPEDFDLEGEPDPDVALDDLLTRWGGHVKDLVDADRGRDFLAEAGGLLANVNGVVRFVALAAMANYVQLARTSRESAIIRVDEWRVAFEHKDRVLTPELRGVLARSFGSQGRFRMFVSHGHPGPEFDLDPDT